MVPMWIYPIALMCGNTMILKPSSHTPGATQLQAELWTEAGGPDGTFNIVYGGREAVQAIVEHPGIAAIQFVGSTAVGRYVFEEGTRRGKRVGSYTSAKNAMIVLPDADMELTADAAVASGYGSAGERCMAQTLVIAVGDAGDRLRPLMLERIANLKVGPAWSRAWTWAPSTPRSPRVGHQLDRREGPAQGRRGPALPQGGRGRPRRGGCAHRHRPGARERLPSAVQTGPRAGPLCRAAHVGLRPPITRASASRRSTGPLSV